MLLLQLLLDPKASEVPNVKLSVYYETLSPSSSWFIYFQPSFIFENGLIDIIDLHLVPSGNATTRNDAIVCEHGEDDCFLNTVEACAIYLLPLVKNSTLLIIYKFVLHPHEFLFCFVKKSVLGVGCIGFLVVPNTIADSKLSQGLPNTNGSVNNRTHKKTRRETAELTPPLQFVPWVLVDGKPLVSITLIMVRTFAKLTKARTCLLSV
ncbi:hypothetical protein IFM89_024175 [Coptis chinensis]|uniref:Uncharacterized protein n=1 Tax=Coptis chinensis TaxID=261450 RepID=A0A835LIC0_9MAGN|nr:hypothetical protein IFM89_024175 [Coptis chinensis]